MPNNNHDYLISDDIEYNETLDTTDNNTDSAVLQQIMNSFDEAVLIDRNKVMAKRVMELLENEPQTSFFFAFGVAHFVGNKSIVEIVKSRGFAVKNISPETAITVKAIPKLRTPLYPASSLETKIEKLLKKLKKIRNRRKK